MPLGYVSKALINRKEFSFVLIHLHPGSVHFCITVSKNSGNSMGSKQHRIIDIVPNCAFLINFIGKKKNEKF